MPNSKPASKTSMPKPKVATSKKEDSHKTKTTKVKAATFKRPLTQKKKLTAIKSKVLMNKTRTNTQKTSHARKVKVKVIRESAIKRSLQAKAAKTSKFNSKASSVLRTANQAHKIMNKTSAPKTSQAFRSNVVKQIQAIAKPICPQVQKRQLNTLRRANLTTRTSVRTNTIQRNARTVRSNYSGVSRARTVRSAAPRRAPRGRGGW